MAQSVQKILEVAMANRGGADQLITQMGVRYMAAMIIAAHTSTTTDFGALAVGDIVVHIPAVAGNAIFYTVATAGTLPAAAVVGDLYMAWRANTLSTYHPLPVA